MKTERIKAQMGNIRVERWFDGEDHREHVHLIDPFDKLHVLALSLAPEAADPDQVITDTVAMMEQQYAQAKARAIERGHLKEDCGCR